MDAVERRFRLVTLKHAALITGIAESYSNKSVDRVTSRGTAMRRTTGYLAITIAALFIIGLISVMILLSFDVVEKNGVVRDFFGRECRQTTPGFMGRDASPGILWEIFDTVVAILVFGVASVLYAWGRRAIQSDKAKSDAETTDDSNALIQDSEAPETPQRVGDDLA